MKWFILSLIDQSLDRLDMERKRERERERERQIDEMVHSILDRSIFR